MTDLEINSSLFQWKLGSVGAEAEKLLKRSCNKIVACEANTEDFRIVASAHQDYEVLFPVSEALRLRRSNGRFARYMSEICKRRFTDYDDAINLEGRSSESAAVGMRRALTLIGLCTGAQSIRSMHGEPWTAFLSSMRERGRYVDCLNFCLVDKLGWSRLGRYLDRIESDYPPMFHFKLTTTARKSNASKITGKDKLFHLERPDTFEHWFSLFDEYLKIRKLKTMKYANAGFRLLCSWLEVYPVEEMKTPRNFLSRNRLSPSFWEFCKGTMGSEMGPAQRSYVSFAVDLVDYYISCEMSEIYEGETIEDGFSILTPKERMDFALLGHGKGNQNAQTRSSPLPVRYLQEVQAILTEGDWKWPKSLTSHRFACVVDNKTELVWNPVVSYLVYAMTLIPWRKIQFKSLDSGEGDAERYDWINDSWVQNLSTNALYWEKLTQAKRKQRGVLNKQNSCFCFYVNTNKTSDRKYDHSELSGYYVPWRNLELIRLFDQLRDWQEKFNPLSGPTPYNLVVSSFSGPDRPSEAIMKSIPDRFYLFRDIQGVDNSFSPPTDNRLYAFWRLLMDELERRLTAKGEDCRIIATRNRSGGPLTSYYNMHGLRVAGLTSFAEAGVPVEILSKLVAGHASILMTFYYLKYTTAHVTDLLDEAKLEIEANSSKDFARFLRNSTLDDVKTKAVANEEYTLASVASSGVVEEHIIDTGLGLCPYNATRCGDGNEYTKGKFIPVQGGSKNCLGCRHFITGEPWLIPLVLNQQKLSIEVSDLSKQMEIVQRKHEELEAERSIIVKSSSRDAIPNAVKRSISVAAQELDRLRLEIDALFNAMGHGHNFIESIKSIQSGRVNDSCDTEFALVRSCDHDDLGPREGTRFEVLDAVVQASRVYSLFHSEKFELERERYLDALMYFNGIQPISMMSLTESQKRMAADAASEWLLRNVGAYEMELMAQGAKTLEDLGYEKSDLISKVSSQDRVGLKGSRSDSQRVNIISHSNLARINADG